MNRGVGGEGEWRSGNYRGERGRRGRKEKGHCRKRLGH